MQKEKIIIAGVLVLAVLAGVFGYLYAGKEPGTEIDFSLPFKKSSQNQVFNNSYSSDLELYDNFFKQVTSTKIIDNKVSSGVLPHHLVAGKYISSFLTALKDQEPKTIVLIGPNHLQKGPDNIVTGVNGWNTPYGILKTDEKLIGELVGAGLKINDEIIKDEWSVSGLVPFIKKTWPKTKIIPIIVKNKADQASLDLLADKLSKILPEKSLVLASVDFSHYLPKDVADFHDELSINTLASSHFPSLKKLEVDSQNSLYALLKYNELKKTQNFSLFSHTNSGDILNQELAETTSHVIGYFKEGEPQVKPEVTMQFFGDIMLDRNVAKAMGADGLDYVFENIRGQENRFFWGMNILSANLEGPFAPKRIFTTKEIAFRFDPSLAKELKSYGFTMFNLANNHMIDMGWANLDFTKKTLADNNLLYFGDELREGPEYTTILGEEMGLPYRIAFIGINNTDHVLEMAKVKKAIIEAKEKAKFVIINVHWGVEYVQNSNKNQQDLARQLVDLGADAIIGTHPHVIQEMEIYNGKPIFYSLGNFVFDQYFSKETQEGLSVGLVFGNDTVKKIYLFPFYSVKSQPQLMSGNRKAEFLDWFQKNSKLGNNKIINGRIEIEI